MSIAFLRRVCRLHVIRQNVHLVLYATTVRHRTKTTSFLVTIMSACIARGWLWEFIAWFAAAWLVCAAVALWIRFTEPDDDDDGSVAA